MEFPIYIYTLIELNSKDILHIRITQVGCLLMIYSFPRIRCINLCHFVPLLSLSLMVMIVNGSGTSGTK